MHDAYASCIYLLTAMVVFYSGHYMCFARTFGHWVLLDDDQDPEVIDGGWEAVQAVFCHRGYEPTLLMHQRADDQCGKESSQCPCHFL